MTQAAAQSTQDVQAFTPVAEDNVLARIVADTRAAIALRKSGDAQSSLQPVERSQRSLADALSAPGPSYILECKKASPSLGPIRPDVSIEDLAAVYSPRANAISVLTNGKYFGGSLDDIRTFRGLTDLPILAKDFFVDPIQLYDARAAGADAVLLMLSVLGDLEYQALSELAENLGLDVLTEVHDETEMARATALGARIIGINNRDLKTLKTDLDVTRRLVPLAPEGAIIVSESGISSRGDILDLADKADAFLIGSAIMQSDDIAAAIDHLQLGDVKICGLTSRTAAEMARDAGATYGGLIFVKESPRYIEPQDAQTFTREMNLKFVGVFRNAPVDNVARTAMALGLAAIQLHGKEDAAYRESLRRKIPKSIEIWQAYHVRDVVPETRPPHADRILLDTYDAKLAGGTGRTFDWALLKGIQDSTEMVLAGGLSPDNIVAAARTGAGILDVNSGVESAPGVKDQAKLGTLFTALRTLPRQTDFNPKDADAPDKANAPGYFGNYGGTFVPEILVPALEALETAFNDAVADPTFQAELGDLLTSYAGRSTPITLCQNILTAQRSAKGRDQNTFNTKAPKLYLKREDLLHGGAHKTNQVLAQALLAKRMGKKRIIAETGAGQHGVATALACALMDLEAVIYMGQEDVRRQQPNVFRMELMGAKVIPVTAGSGTLKDAVNEALRDWTASYETTHYLLGTAAGPHPYPTMVRDFQRIIGDEARAQILAAEGKLPSAVVACVGGGSNAIGMFTAFVGDEDVKLFGVEPAGHGLDTDAHGATLIKGSPGVLHGSKTFILQDQNGQIRESHSISAGLDYPAVGPEHAMLKQIGRAEYVGITDEEALSAFQLLSRTEGIIPALESAHALAYALKLADSGEYGPDDIILVNLSGRGDKDLAHVRSHLEGPNHDSQDHD